MGQRDETLLALKTEEGCHKECDLQKSWNGKKMNSPQGLQKGTKPCHNPVGNPVRSPSDF